MQSLAHYIINGWPPTKDHLPQPLQAYWHFREELSVADGILLKATRAIVPPSLRPSMLTKIHHSHRGPEYCLRFARDAIFWPSMSKDIEEFCHSCATCAQYGKQAADEPMLSHPTPTLPWQFVSQDIFTFGHKQYLVTVDHYSDFYELDELVDTLSTTVINLTKAHFARHGIPLRCLTDNGPQFVSHEYKTFAQTFDFEHVTSSPYWSRSNGKAEAAVSDAKSVLKRSPDIYLALLNIRNTPPRGHSFSPAQRLMGRRTRSTIPLSEQLLRPEIADPPTVSSEINRRKIASKAQYDKHAQAPLMPLPLGSHVYAKPRPSQWGSPWIYGQIINSTAPRSYSIDTGNSVLRCNRAQLRPAAPPECTPVQPLPLPLMQASVPAPPECPPAQQQPAIPPQLDRPTTPPPPQLQPQGQQISDPPPVHDNQQITRSGRVVRPPQRFKDFVPS